MIGWIILGVLLALFIYLPIFFFTYGFFNNWSWFKRSLVSVLWPVTFMIGTAMCLLDSGKKNGRRNLP